jgi:hypothetical protein
MQKDIAISGQKVKKGRWKRIYLKFLEFELELKYIWKFWTLFYKREN